MNALRPYRLVALLLFLCGTLVLTACSGGGEARTILTDPATSNDAGVVVSSLPPVGPGGGTGIVEAPSLTTPSPATTAVIPTTSIAASPVTTGPAAEPANPDNLYALVGARAIAAKANESDLSGLEQDVLTEVLLEAGEAAYEIEYPSDVMYLDVGQDDRGNLMVVTEDESQTIVGSAYVCVVDGKAVAREDACASTSSN
jgi:hypothetical protein